MKIGIWIGRIPAKVVGIWPFVPNFVERCWNLAICAEIWLERLQFSQKWPESGIERPDPTPLAGSWPFWADPNQQAKIPPFWQNSGQLAGIRYNLPESTTRFRPV
jgi:hypothetical protein